MHYPSDRQCVSTRQAPICLNCCEEDVGCPTPPVPGRDMMLIPDNQVNSSPSGVKHIRCANSGTPWRWECEPSEGPFRRRSGWDRKRKSAVCRGIVPLPRRMPNSPRSPTPESDHDFMSLAYENETHSNKQRVSEVSAGLARIGLYCGGREVNAPYPCRKRRLADT